MTSKIFLYIKALIFAFLFDLPAVRLIIGACLMIGYIYWVYYSSRYPKPLLSIQELSMNKKAIVASIIYIFFLIAFLFVIRVTSTGKELDLSVIVPKLWSYIIDHFFFNLFCTLIFYVSLLLLLLRLMSIIRNHIYVLYYRIHIYLWHYPFYKQRIVQDTFFSLHNNYLLYALCFTVINLYAKASSKHLYRTTGIDLKDSRSQIYHDLCNKYWRWIERADFIDQHLAIILILLSIIYDLFRSPYKLLTIFYVLPIAFLYQIFITLARFYFNCNLSLDSVIHRFLYKPSIIHPEGIILEEGGFFEPNVIDKEVFDSLTKYMLNNFRYGLGSTTILDEIQKKYGKT